MTRYASKRAPPIRNMKQLVIKDFSDFINKVEELNLFSSLVIFRGQPEKDQPSRAQHSGLKTRLLDWTSNALAALWCACVNPKKGDVHVYALESSTLIVKDVYDKDPFSPSSTRVFQPRLNNARIIAQHGWFTLHRYSRKAEGFVSLEDNSTTSPLLTEIRVLGGIRDDILESLDRHGINQRTLFPDLVGLCKHLNWKYKLTE